METIIRDASGRTFRKLRLSVTSACNYRCFYCNPAQSGMIHGNDHSSEQKENLSLHRHLTAGQLVSYTLAIHGITHLNSVRITGGEPTLYPHLAELIRLLKAGGIPKVSITTNGSVLYKNIAALKDAGLDSVNISLDALDPDVFRSMTGSGNLEDVMKSVDSCISHNIPLKINCTVVRGKNENQILPLFNYCKDRNISIRYIELMEMGHLKNSVGVFLYPEDQILKDISACADFRILPRKSGSTAREFITADGYVFGVISNTSHPFCEDCDRLRLDSAGNLFGCLSVNKGENINEIKVSGSAHASVTLKQILKRALQNKKTDRFTGSSMSMKNIGG